MSAGDPNSVQGHWRVSYYNNQLRFITPNLQVSASAPAPGAWHHVAVTRFGNSFKVYVDGTESADVTHAGSITIPSGATLRIGGTAGSEWEGRIDDVAISSESTTWYGNVSPGATLNIPTTTALWYFSEGTGTVALDSSVNGNGHHGTINGAAWR